MSQIWHCSTTHTHIHAHTHISNCNMHVHVHVAVTCTHNADYIHVPNESLILCMFDVFPAVSFRKWLHGGKQLERLIGDFQDIAVCHLPHVCTMHTLPLPTPTTQTFTLPPAVIENELRKYLLYNDLALFYIELLVSKCGCSVRDCH